MPKDSRPSPPPPTLFAFLDLMIIERIWLSLSLYWPLLCVVVVLCTRLGGAWAQIAISRSGLSGWWNAVAPLFFSSSLVIAIDGNVFLREKERKEEETQGRTSPWLGREMDLLNHKSLVGQTQTHKRAHRPGRKGEPDAKMRDGKGWRKVPPLMTDVMNPAGSFCPLHTLSPWLQSRRAHCRSKGWGWWRGAMTCFVHFPLNDA